MPETFSVRGVDGVQKEHTAGTPAVPTTSKNGAEVGLTLETPAGYANSYGQIHEVEGQANPVLTGQEEQREEAMRIHDHVPIVPQIVFVQGNNNTGRGKLSV